jgi:hypothetical protein
LSNRGPPGGLDERHPVAAVGAGDLAHHQVVAGVHCADLDLLVWKDRDNAVPDGDDHLLIGVSAPDRELLA